jgi:proteic killer suppression protein
MIKSFKHKGLEKFYQTGSKKGIQASHSNKLRMQLAALDTAQSLEDVDVPCGSLLPVSADCHVANHPKIFT